MIYSGGSKSLEALRMMEQVSLVANVANMEEQVGIIEKSLITLEIIKKRFTIQFIESGLPNPYGIMQIGINPVYIKTKEEFDLLKEILKGGK